MKFTSDEILGWAHALFAFAFAFLAAVLGLQFLLMMLPITNWRTDGPAWVQAFGSIGAILIAIFVGNRASTKAKEHAHDMDLILLERKNQSICAVLDDADIQCREILAEFEARGTGFDLQRDLRIKPQLFVAYQPTAFAAALTSIQEIPLHELGSYTAVRGIASLRNSMINIQRFHDELLRVNQLDSNDVLDGVQSSEQQIALDDFSFDAAASALITEASAAHAAYVDAVTALGGTPTTVQATKYSTWITEVHDTAISVQNVVNKVLAQDSI